MTIATKIFRFFHKTAGWGRWTENQKPGTGFSPGKNHLQ
jgi:hypothetical protein